MRPTTRKFVLLAVSLLMVASLSASMLPDPYGGLAFDSRERLTTALFADVIGKWGFTLSPGTLESVESLAIGIGLDVPCIAEKLKLDYYWSEKLKVVGYCNHNFTRKDWSGGLFVAIIGAQF